MQWLRFVGLAALGPLGLFAVVALWFASQGHFADYFDANFAANVGYVADRVDFPQLGWMVLRRVREAFPLWLSLALAPLCLALAPSLDSPTRRGLAAGLLWAAFAFPGICATGRLWAHYFLELLPAQCLVTALLVCWSIDVGSERSRLRTAILLAFIFLGSILRAVEKPIALTLRTVQYRYVKGVDHWGDVPALVAEYLAPRVSPSDYLYVVDRFPILYYLVPSQIPTRFPFPQHLTDEWWKRMTRVDPLDELRAIFAKKPRYVVKAEEAPTPFYHLLHEELDRNYQLEHAIGEVELYRRRD